MEKNILPKGEKGWHEKGQEDCRLARKAAAMDKLGNQDGAVTNAAGILCLVLTSDFFPVSELCQLFVSSLFPRRYKVNEPKGVYEESLQVRPYSGKSLRT